MAIVMRPVGEHDRDRLLAWRNQPDVSRYMHTDHVISPEEHARWFERMLADESVLYRVIELDGEPVGLACVTGIDRLHRRCSWAFYLASPSVRGRGVGSFVEHWVLSHVFGVLGLDKLCCEVLDFNEPVIAMHRSFGFVEEGRLRRHIVKPQGPCDVIVMSMLRDEWEANRPAIEERLRAKGLLPADDAGGRAP